MTRNVDPLDHQEFRALMQAVPAALIVLGEVGEITDLSRQAETLFGYAPAELIGHSVNELIHPREGADEHGFAARSWRGPQTGGPIVVDLCGRRKDGREFPAKVELGALALSGRVLTLATIEDSTASRASDDRFGRLLEAAPDAMVITDVHGTIVLVNAQTEVLFGYKRGELLGCSVEMMIPERYRAAHPHHRARYFGGPGTRAMGAGGLRLFGLRKDGSEFPVEISLSPLDAGEGRLAITAIRDITDRVKADEERSKLNQAQEAIRMRDEFLSVASHELKTPLTALQLRTESIIRSIKRSADVETVALMGKKAAAIQGAADQLTKLVNQLLDLSRITAGRLMLEAESVDLLGIVERVIAQFADTAVQQGCEIQFDVKASVVGSWDPLRIEQIAGNLLSNAIKYGHGRPVVVSVQLSDSGFAVLEVRDHGIGIPIEDQDRIFERFERLVPHRDYKGVGLGLWIAKQLVAAHQGSIRVWSEPGVGSTFTVELPLTAARAPAGAPESSPTVDSQCVMLVEDDAMTRTSFEEALRDEGFQIVTAANGWEALRLLRAGARPRLLFLDLIMPIMDAKTFIDHKSSDPSLADIPVVIMSAAKGIEERSAALGAVTFLRKPVRLDAVIKTVEQYGRPRNFSGAARQ